LGIPDDFFEKLGIPVSENNKLQWLKYQHLNYDRKLELYYFIQRRGDKIKELSKKTILILIGNDT
jgi:hypothetical protein